MALKPKAMGNDRSPALCAQWKKPAAGRRQRSASGIVLSFTNDVNGRIADRLLLASDFWPSTLVPAPRSVHQKNASRVPSCCSEAKGDRARECSASAPFPPPKHAKLLISL